MKRRSGFTLVEMMIVIALIGLLAGIGTFSLRKARKNSRIGYTQGELEMLATAVEQLAWDTGEWPNGEERIVLSGTGDDPLISDLENSRIMSNLSASDEWKGPYYDGAFLDPWGNEYFFDLGYRQDGGQHVVVGSYGPNTPKMKYDEDAVIVIVQSVSSESD